MTATKSDALAHPLLDTDSTTYVPYTPRPRPAKPPLASLRAAAQSLGLDAGSVGWAMLDRIAYEGDEWAEIWTALTKARVRPVAALDRLLTVCRRRCCSPRRRVQT
jgi:hypothetical protein